MKTILYILIITMIAISNLNSLDKQQYSEDITLSSAPSITIINETSINLGTYYPESVEQLYNKHIEFRIDGDDERTFYWEITEIVSNDIKLNVKFFGSSEGRNWTEIARSGSALLNESGHYFIKIDILQLEVKTGATDGDIDNYITVTVDY